MRLWFLLMLAMAAMPLASRAIRAESLGNVKTVCSKGCDEPELLSAWHAALKQARLTTDVVVLQLKPGRYELQEQLFSDCSCGQQVHVMGDTGNPAAVTLVFTNVSGTNLGGFVAADGGRIGGLDGVTLLAQGASLGDAKWRAQSYGGGIVAKGAGSNIAVGAHVVVTGFYYGALADQGGRIVANGATFRNAGDANLLARFGGVIECTSCMLQEAGHRLDPTAEGGAILGYNALAEGGSLYIDRARLQGGLVACVGAQSNGIAWAHQVQATGCNNIGAKASQNGFIELGGSRLTNGGVGVRADTGGGLNLDNVEIDHNRSDGLQLDGGHATGSRLHVHDNDALGIRISKQGRGEFYATRALLQNNRVGQFLVDPATGCRSATDLCSPAATLILQ